MEAELKNRAFFASFGNTNVCEARESFADFYGREPEVCVEQRDSILAGPISKEEMYGYRVSEPITGGN